MNNPIVIISAIRCEYEYILKQMNIVKEYKEGIFSVFEGYIDKKYIVIVNSLMGMVNAACAAYFAISKYHPSLIISEGTSGAHNPNLKQGDIVLGKDIINLGSFIALHKDENEGTDIKSYIRKGFNFSITDSKITWIDKLHSDSNILETAKKVSNKYGKVILGTHASSDSWNKEIDLIKYYHESLNTDLEEMEGFSIAQVAYTHNVPFIAIRIISNSEYRPNEIFDIKYGEYCAEFVFNFIKELN